jgi:hypothetical protein
VDHVSDRVVSYLLTDWEKEQMKKSSNTEKMLGEEFKSSESIGKIGRKQQLAIGYEDHKLFYPFKVGV